MLGKFIFHFRFGWLTFFFVLCWAPGPVQAFDLKPGFGPHGGATFRGDEGELRKDGLSETYFMEFFSYQHPLGWRSRWKDIDMGYRITAGSLTNDELYLDQEARLRLGAMEDQLWVNFHFHQDEDFDSRYMRTLVDIHFFPLGSLFIGGTGELIPDKEESDLGFVGGYRDDRVHVRIDFNQPNLFTNDKGMDGQRFRTFARTTLVKAEVKVTDELTLGAFGEFGRRLDWRSSSTGYDLRMEKNRWGVNGHYYMGERFLLEAGVIGETTKKRRRALGALGDPNRDHDLERQAVLGEAVLGILLQEERDHAVAFEIGFHGVYLREPVELFNPAPARFNEERREGFLSVGGAYEALLPSVSDTARFSFNPVFYLGYQDSVRLSRSDTTGIPNLAKKERGFISKISPRLTLEIEENVAFLFNATQRLDSFEFGGMNIQVIFRF